MKCKNCSFEISEDDIYCPNCGKKVEQNQTTQTEKQEELGKELMTHPSEQTERQCENCHYTLNEDDSFCPNCGKNVEQTSTTKESIESDEKKKVNINSTKHCDKCNFELSEDDAFCPNCGYRIEQLQPVNDSSQNENKQSERSIQTNAQSKDTTNTTNGNNKKSKKKLYILISSIAILAVIGIGTFFLLNQPKDIHIEASELGELIHDENAKKYAGDHLYVHGYLQRTDDEERLFSLKGSKNETTGYDFVLFTYDKGIDENLGENSEITITGELGEYKDSEIVVLIGREIEVHKSEENIIDAGDTESLLLNMDELINKKVIVTGKLNTSNVAGVFLNNGDDFESILLNNISYSEIEKYIDEHGTWCQITGTPSFDTENHFPSIKVESIDSNAGTDILNEDEIADQEVSVDDVLKNPEQYLNRNITIYGNLSQSTNLDHQGNECASIFGESGDFIVLTGKQINIGGCKAVLKGYLTKGSHDYFLEVSDYYRI